MLSRILETITLLSVHKASRRANIAYIYCNSCCNNSTRRRSYCSGKFEQRYNRNHPEQYYGMTNRNSTTITSTTREHDDDDDNDDDDECYNTLIRRLNLLNSTHHHHHYQYRQKKQQLDTSLNLRKLLNFPDRHYPIIHIVGTNGKGSVAYKIANTLHHYYHQSKVGLYTSPHISTFRERVRINDNIITKNAVRHHLHRIFSILDGAHHTSASFFELMTMMALNYFKQERVQFAVIEAGLGGRFDATNVIDAPLLVVITSISLDHVKVLGNTLKQICKEKAGVLKRGVRAVVVGPSVPDGVVRPIAEKLNIPYVRVPPVRYSVHNIARQTADEENTLIAECAISLLTSFHPRLSVASNDDSILDKALSVRPSCRYERVLISRGTCMKQLVILDVAHNTAAFEQLAHQLLTEFSRHRLRFVLGVSRDKIESNSHDDYTASLKPLVSIAQALYIVRAENNERAATPPNIKQIIQQSTNRIIHDDDDNNKKSCQHISHTTPLYVRCMTQGSVADGVRAAIKDCSTQHKDLVIVCGSFFIMAEAKAALGMNQQRDPFDLNEATNFVRHNTDE